MKIDINSEAYKKQLDYFNKNYGAEYRFNQGTEEILNMLNLFSKPGRLIDFGSGSNIYFWLSAMNNIFDVTCVDISPEAFFINEQIRNKTLTPKSFDVVTEKYNTNIDEMFKNTPQYIVIDIFNETLSLEDMYDNVSQFGLLGLSKTKDEYKINFSKLWKFLKLNGMFMGANWLFSKSFSELKGFSNSYLNCDIIDEIAHECHGILHENKLITIEKDTDYTHVLMYTMEKKYD